MSFTSKRYADLTKLKKMCRYNACKHSKYKNPPKNSKLPKCMDEDCKGYYINSHNSTYEWMKFKKK